MGSTFRFVHCADLHLGGRFKGVSAADPALGEAMRESLRTSFSRIVDLAVAEKADALIISGDVYDDSGYLPSLRIWFAGELARAGMPVFISRGNHDSSASWESSIPYPDNVFEFGTEPETVEVDTPGGTFEVTGVSFSEPHERRNLASMLSGSPDMFTVACLHCDVDSASEGYRYAPCRYADLLSRGVDYWALGHIHKRQVLNESPYVVYPGNIQGRSIRETGEKGAYVVSVTDGRVSELRFVPTQVYLWKEEAVDITGRDLDTAVSGVTFGRGDIGRLVFTGSGDLDGMLRSHPGDVARALESRFGCVMLEPKVATSPERARSEGDMMSLVASKAESVAGMTKEEILGIILRQKMAARHREFYESLPEEELRAMVREAAAGFLASMKVMG